MRGMRTIGILVVLVAVLWWLSLVLWPHPACDRHWGGAQDVHRVRGVNAGTMLRLSGEIFQRAGKVFILELDTSEVVMFRDVCGSAGGRIEGDRVRVVAEARGMTRYKNVFGVDRHVPLVAGKFVRW